MDVDWLFLGVPTKVILNIIQIIFYFLSAFIVPWTVYNGSLLSGYRF